MHKCTAALVHLQWCDFDCSSPVPKPIRMLFGCSALHLLHVAHPSSSQQQQLYTRATFVLAFTSMGA